MAHAFTAENFGATFPERRAFLEEASAFNVIPVTRSLLADAWTPVTAFRLLAARDPHAFLFESVEGGEREGRYSFLGRNPFLVFRARGEAVHAAGDDAQVVGKSGRPLDRLRETLGAFRSPVREGLPPFLSGAVGYLAYDAVRWLERLPDLGHAAPFEADLELLFPYETAAFDNVARRLTLVANARIRSGEPPQRAYDEAEARLSAMERALAGSPVEPVTPSRPAEQDFPEAQSRAEFCQNVERAKMHIAAGDVFQVVLSRRRLGSCPASDLSVYRALRSVNPSPYMFLLRMEGWSAIG
ncbi:MAG TPA: chorismate-binding protein, partial [Candidatus Eisenbacteria bacterium]|nr:chorismate-binding protein [Candidatus Eisenbacteria bacterium]